MSGYLIKRLLLMIPTLIGISIISFVIIQLAPGDPATLRVGNALSGVQDIDQVIRETRAIYGLDQPLYLQYWRWAKRIATLDFGESLRDHRPIIDLLKERVPVSLRLSLISLVLAYLIAIPIGIYSATHRHSIGDKISTVALFALYSLPNFWIATMAIVFLGGGDFWNVFPVGNLSTMGSEHWSMLDQIKDQAWHLVLPITCLTYYILARLSRYMRSSMLEVIHQDFIRTARAKGLSERLVIYRHALRNSLIPMVTLIADILPALIGGSVVVESIFSIPGLGQLSFEAVLNRDYPLIMAIFTLSAILTLTLILLSDFVYTLVDPRIAYENSAS